MKTINFAKDFTRFLTPFHSSEKFRTELLISALRSGEQINVNMDETLGFSSAFLSDSFGNLVSIHGYDAKWLHSHLTFSSLEDPTLVTEIWSYIDSAKPVPTNCPDCGVEPGQNHHFGCDIERCLLCGNQQIGCNCIYELNNIKHSDLEFSHPEIWAKGPTPEMYQIFDAKINELGGPLPWIGFWPGTKECIEFGFISEDGAPDFNQLTPFTGKIRWSPSDRKWVKLQPIGEDSQSQSPTRNL